MSSHFQNNLITAKQLSDILGLSTRQIFRLDSSGKIPAAKRIGGAVRWSANEIYQWIEAGTPSREDWEKIRHDSGW